MPILTGPVDPRHSVLDCVGKQLLDDDARPAPPHRADLVRGVGLSSSALQGRVQPPCRGGDNQVKIGRASVSPAKGICSPWDHDRQSTAGWCLLFSMIFLPSGRFGGHTIGANQDGDRRRHRGAERRAQASRHRRSCVRLGHVVRRTARSASRSRQQYDVAGAFSRLSLDQLGSTRRRKTACSIRRCRRARWR